MSNAYENRSALRGLIRLFQRARSVLNNDRGSAMIEVLGVMVVVALATSMFAQSSIGLGKTQNRLHNTDVSIQVARGILEQASATPWNKVGFIKGDPGYQDTFTVNGTPERTVQISAVNLPDGRILPKTTKTVRGLPVSAVTDITWFNNGTVMKRITVTTTWNQKGRSESSVYSLLLSASPNDVAPESVPKVP